MRRAAPVAALAPLALLLTAAGPVQYGGWQAQSPGTMHLIRPQDLPRPYATRSVGDPPEVVARPPGAALHAPAGFHVGVWAHGLDGPRAIRIAPNGDVFVTESGAGRVRVFRPRTDGGTGRPAVFAAGLDRPFGIAFWPPGPSPRFVYVAETGRVLRFPYDGSQRAAGPARTVATLPDGGGHWTRDIAFSPDGRHLFVSVGSADNDAADMPATPPGGLAQWRRIHPPGAAWGPQTRRADVLVFDPEGREERIFATGLRNCAGLTIQPATAALWCVVNERDGLGDNLPPDYATRVAPDGFYGWPWYYIGDHQDPRHKGARPDLAGRVTVPDVLLQPHVAPLGIVFYDGSLFPQEYRGDAFVALHGSWNRAPRAGYEIVRLRMQDGRPTGAYDDFVTGFVVDAGRVWGRPVDVAVARDGSLLFTEDGNDTIWRVTYDGRNG